MDYSHVFEISASGMHAQKLRLEVAAHNLANVNTVSQVDGQPYRPMKVVAYAARVVGDARPFSELMASSASSVSSMLGGVAVSVVPDASTPNRLAHEPGHPFANAQGMVSYPGINHVEQMMTVTEALRAYEANVAVMQASRSMAARALDIGGGQ